MRKNRFSFSMSETALRTLAVLGLMAVAVVSLGASSPRAGVPASSGQTELLTIIHPAARPGTPLLAAAAPAAPAAAAQPVPAPTPVPELVGSEGYALAYGNCVNEPGVNNPGYGNPADWPVTASAPTIGATAVFTWNHVGVVTGIWANGDIEVRHQNYWGGAHRFPPSMIRGYR